MTAAPTPEVHPVSLDAIGALIHEINEANGWYEDPITRDDQTALLHTEISEAFEAFRDHGFEDATAHVSAAGCIPKPEGVGSELADVLIRLLDTLGRRGEKVWWTTMDLTAFRKPYWTHTTFGGWVSEMHRRVSEDNLTGLLISLIGAADFAGVDLLAETHRKLAFNRTRGYRHGGKRI